MLSSLISQIIKYNEPVVKVVTLRDPICSMCKERPRVISALSGKAATYCRECRQEKDHMGKARRAELYKERVKRGANNDV